MRHPPAILAGAALVVGALGLSMLAPTEEQMQSPYVTRVDGLGERVDLRTFSITFSGARLADRVHTDEWSGATDGVWLIVDLTYQRALTAGGIRGSLRIGDTRYATSARPDRAAVDIGGTGSPGLPVAGSMLIELPRSALDAPGARDAVLRIGTDRDAFLDDVAELHLDLGSLEHVMSAAILEPGRVAP